MNLPYFNWLKKYLMIKKAEPQIDVPNLLFQDKLKEDILKTSVKNFKTTVIQTAENLKIDPNFLMGVFELETASTFDPAITNSLGYTGLIQFGEVAAKSIGTTTAKLRKMNAVEQLKYVEKYFWPYRKRLKTYTDVYFAVFFPVAIGKANDWVLQAKGLSSGKIASWNPLFDINKDREIKVAEVKRKLKDRLPNEYKYYVDI